MKLVLEVPRFLRKRRKGKIAKGYKYYKYVRRGRTLYFFTYWDTKKDRPVSRRRAYGMHKRGYLSH